MLFISIFGAIIESQGLDAGFLCYYLSAWGPTYWLLFNDFLWIKNQLEPSLRMHRHIQLPCPCVTMGG